MNRMVKRLMVVLMSVFMVLGTVTTPVQAKNGSSNTNGWGSWWGWWWPVQPTNPEPDPEPEPTEEPVVEEEEPVVTEEPIIEEEPVVTEEPVIEEEPVVEEEPVIEEEPVVEEQPVDEEETPVAIAYPEKDFEPVEVNGTTVNVYAPEGALPEGATLEVTEVSLEDVQAAVDAAADISGTVLAAVDITFYDANGVKIEPTEGSEVKVSITAPEIAETEKVEIVHIPDEEEPETVDQVDEDETAEDEVAFVSDSFSIYAVVESGDTGEYARATVNFWKDTGKTENRATVYVKNKDTAEELVKIIYDPGVGTLSEGQVFRGWTDDPNYTADTKGKTVADIRAEMEAKAITEGDTVDYYAMIFQIYNIAYQDEFEATIKTDVIFIRADSESPEYKITEDYVPADPNKKFNGWHVKSGTVAPVQDNYPVNTTVTVSSDVIFSANAPSGAWLSFNENGRGSSYTPPEFVADGAVTTEPDDPTRRGYTFGGWYTGAPATEGGDPTGELFEFGNPLTVRTDVYAKWNPVATAPYTVIIWQQRATDDKNATDANKTYDVWEVVTGLSGTVGSTINTVLANGSNVNTGRTNPTQTRNVRVNGREFAKTGFHYNRMDQNVTIAPEGNTVFNVYYDRNLITITFNTATAWNSNVRNYYFNIGNGRVHNATVSGLFDAEIDFTWPDVCYSNTTTSTETNAMWQHGSNVVQNGTLTFYGSYKLSAPAQVQETLTLTGAGNNRVYFYRQNNDGTWPAADEATNIAAVSGNSNSFTLREKYAGFTLYKYKSGAFVQADNNQWNTATAGNDAGISNGRLNIRFTRDRYPIRYFDGTYFDGNGVVLQAATTEFIDDTDPIYYEADISSYGEGGSNYYVPDVIVPGYTFSGWYLDQTCTHPAVFDKMPQGGVTVYAKWVQTQYRVFLHPNVPETDTLEWGQTNQQMNFRVTNGEKISGGHVINGDRAGRTYELIGWFTDPSLANEYYYNFDTELNDTTVPEEPKYDKTKDFTDTMNKYGRITDAGSNSDVDRPWITRKLDLYAKWREILPGAKGINVVYDPADGYGQPNDTLEYLDNSESIAQAASRPNDTAKQFKGWVLQTWNGTEYVDKTGEIINPGDPFTVLKADAKQEPRLDDEGNPMYDDDNNPLYTYTVVLKAVYDEFEPPIPTYINWYKNDQEDSERLHKDEDVQINEALDIYTLEEGIPVRGGYKFLGWAREEEFIHDENNQPVGDAIRYYPDAELYIKWVEAEGETEAHYETMDGKTVTQVAADEEMPYQAFYAVWEPMYFYVFHSSNSEIEAITLDGDTFNIVEKVYEGTLYGGYYNAYIDLNKDSASIVAAKEAAKNAETKKAVVEGATSYDGSLLKPAGSSTRFWTKANAYLTAGDSIPATEIHEGDVFFLKEVPDTYLNAYFTYVYNYNTYAVSKFYLLTGIDDTYYSSVGYYVTSNDYVAKISASFSYKRRNDSNLLTTIKPQDVFNITRGYFGVCDAENLLSNLPEGAVATTPYWVTLDGVEITNKKVKRTVKFSADQREIEIND